VEGFVGEGRGDVRGTVGGKGRWMRDTRHHSMWFIFCLFAGYFFFLLLFRSVCKNKISIRCRRNVKQTTNFQFAHFCSMGKSEGEEYASRGRSGGVYVPCLLVRLHGFVSTIIMPVRLKLLHGCGSSPPGQT